MISSTVLATQPDGKLVRLAAAGSEPAFEAIVHRYRRPLLGYCRRLRLSDNRSEDIVQQTFLNAWGSLRGGAQVRELRPWLYRITHNQIVTALRAPGGDDRPLSEVTGGSEVVSLAGGPSTRAAAEVYERQARLRETLSAVAALPPLQREALLGTAVDGLSYDEVAAVLNTSADAVRGLVYRARSTLRSGVAVLSPAPLVLWAANQAAQVVSSVTVQQWVTEAGAGGGSLGLGAVALKGAAVLASSAAVVGGSVDLAHHPSAERTQAAGHRVSAVRSTASSTAVSPPSHAATAAVSPGDEARVETARLPLGAREGAGSLGSPSIVRAAGRTGLARGGAARADSPWRADAGRASASAAPGAAAVTPIAPGLGAGFAAMGAGGAGLGAGGAGLGAGGAGLAVAPSGPRMGSAVRPQKVVQAPSPAADTAAGSAAAGRSNAPENAGDSAGTGPTSAAPAASGHPSTAASSTTTVRPSTAANPTMTATSPTTTVASGTTTAASATTPAASATTPAASATTPAASATTTTLASSTTTAAGPAQPTHDAQ